MTQTHRLNCRHDARQESGEIDLDAPVAEIPPFSQGS